MQSGSNFNTRSNEALAKSYFYKLKKLYAKPKRIHGGNLGLILSAYLNKPSDS